jgi:hypothetical protein
MGARFSIGEFILISTTAFGPVYFHFARLVRAQIIPNAEVGALNEFEFIPRAECPERVELARCQPPWRPTGIGASLPLNATATNDEVW